ncbi:MAG: arginine--tRNA ligase, partial [Sphingomonas sp.]
MTLYSRFAAYVDAALDALEAAGDLPSGIERRAVTVEPPRDPAHGDLATNAAMVLAKAAKTNPRALAEKIGAALQQLDEVAAVEIAGPGFINLRLVDDSWRAELAAIHDRGADYGRSTVGQGTTV